MSAARKQIARNVQARSARGWSWRSELNLTESEPRRVYANRFARTDAPHIFRTTRGVWWVGDWRRSVELATGPFPGFEAAEINWLLVKDERLL